MSYFTRQELTHGRDVQFPLSPSQEQNLEWLIGSLNVVRRIWGRPMIISSGYRPASINSSVGGAKKSAHMDCQAADIIDKDGSLAEFLLNNLDILEQAGLYLESPDYTYSVNKDGNRVSGWVHLQIRRPGSGNRVFIPYSSGPKLKVVG